MKACKDCRWCVFVGIEALDTALCMRPTHPIEGSEEVIGETECVQLGLSCMSQRQDIADYYCGKQARFWEAK